MFARTTACAAALSVSALVLVGVAAPASAQDSGQGSTNCPASGEGPGNAPGQSPEYPPAQGEGVSDSSPARGEQVNATSGCREFAPGQSVAFGVESVFQQLGTVIATVGGEASATFVVPTNLSNGQHHVVFRGTGFNGAPNEVRIPFVVSGGPSTAVPDAGAPPVTGTPDQGGTVNVGGVSLPRTGSDEVVPLALLGLGLVAGGAGMVVVARRRRSDVGGSLA